MISNLDLRIHLKLTVQDFTRALHSLGFIVSFLDFFNNLSEDFQENVSLLKSQFLHAAHEL
jgi:hypothetical protein